MAGSGLFLVWFAEPHDWMLYAGLLAVPGFLLFILLGFISVGAFVRQSRRSNTPYIRRTLLAIVLLLMNFPAGAGLAYFALTIKTAYVIQILNNTNQAIETIKLTDPKGHEFVLAPVSPHEQIQQTLRFEGEGQVKYRLEIGGIVKTGILLGYITNNMGGQAHLTIETGGRIAINEK